ncbi:MAG TPA: pyridoxal-phosphate dependent enzyme, partial [Gaiellaceae bacterium]|nr:pyridoxal-phosphate dependent enzyme [Gaiellaceae bacterium]
LALEPARHGRREEDLARLGRVAEVGAAARMEVEADADRDRQAAWPGVGSDCALRLDRGRIDAVEVISDAEAVEMTLRLSREEGIFAGISTGANLVGTLRVAERLGPEDVVVTLAVDSGFKYMSTEPYAAL